MAGASLPEPMTWKRVSSGSDLEEEAGYCRALRADGRVLVSGTAPVAEGGGVAHPGDAAAQARRCWDIVEEALADLDADLSDVVRTRMYVTEQDVWEEVTDVHGEVFGDHPPATTLVVVDALVHDDFLVEVEAEAVVDT
jgi:isochorismate pyruvate lyase